VAPTLRIIRPIEAYARKKAADAQRVLGGKGAKLAWLSRHGFPVPRTWVLDIKPFRRIVRGQLPPSHDPHSLLRLRHPAVLLERAARARAQIMADPLPQGLSRDVATLWSLVEPYAPWGLAIRSSATCEDDDVTSMAGLAQSEIGVRGPEAIERALKKVWASALLPRALSYLASRGVRDFAMAVVFQIVVRADAAGVVFTAPPAGLDGESFGPGEMLVNAGSGLGIPVVDGAATHDVARVDRATGKVLEYLPAEKQSAFVVDGDGLREMPLTGEARQRRAVGDRPLALLAAYARKLETLEPNPMDLEFAVEGDDVWLLQARPASGAGYPEGGDAETVWSRANVGEALPGPATPLTWSIARSFSERGFRKAFASLGCNVPRGLRLVANVHARFYLNLTAFMRIAAQVPGLDPRTLVDLGGGSGADVLERQVQDVSKRGFYARLPVTATRLLTEQMRLGKEVERFETHAERAHRTITDIDLTILPDDGLVTTLRDTRRLLDVCGSLMLSCASASLASHVALKTVLARSLPVDSERIAQALSAGIGDLESARPGIALAHVAAIARHDEGAFAELAAGGVRSADDLPDGPLRRALLQYLATYGDRAVREAELMTPRWREDPAPLIGMLRAAMRAPAGDPEGAVLKAREMAARELAELAPRLSLVEMALVRVLVARSQRFARLRERMRAWVTRVLGMLRSISLEIDRRLIRVEPSLGSGAVFFCTFDELALALTSNRTDIQGLVRLRRAEYARDAARPDPPVTFVGRPPPVVLPPASGGYLRGLPASGGVVEGPARVLTGGARGADELVPGEILVARTTDVGLSPLFLVAAGVVTELGGPLSHAALVAREYGVPAVVNVRGATQAIRTGDWVRVDGNRGIVERLLEAGERRSDARS
jgi:pyruvate,water dikinase